MTSKKHPPFRCPILYFPQASTTSSVLLSSNFDELTLFLTFSVNVSKIAYSFLTTILLSKYFDNKIVVKKEYHLKTEGNLLLKIPPEVLPTVEAIVADVQEKQAFYAKTIE